MPIFLDVHKIPSLDKNIQELIDLPKDELGVTHINIFYNREADLCYCLLEAPSKEAVEKHHSKINVKCDWINEVTMAKK
jgi:hypothetical protein